MIYMAPEILEFDHSEAEGTGVKAYTKESDIYAFAYICFEVSFCTYFILSI